MKKALTFLLLAALLATPLVGCHKDDSDEPAKTTTENNANTIPEYNAADANPASDFEYKVREDGGITITKYIGEDETVVIPQNIDGKEVTLIGERAFAGTSILSVAMPDTILYIASYAFYGCKQLKTVRFGDNIQLILDEAFYDCESMESVILPKNLKELGQYAFGNCLAVQKIWIPKTVEKWGWSPFIGNISVKEIIFEDGLKKIGSYGAFTGCQVEVLRIPASVESIADIAFTAFPNLKEVYFDGAAPTVGGDVFATPEQGVKIYYNPSMPGWDTTLLRDVYTLVPKS